LTIKYLLKILTQHTILLFFAKNGINKLIQLCTRIFLRLAKGIMEEKWERIRREGRRALANCPSAIRQQKMRENK
jgi:hypothetical protein